MVNLFFFFNFDHYYQKNVFAFLEKTPVHKVTLHSDKKHVEGSPVYGKPNATVTDKNE